MSEAMAKAVGDLSEAERALLEAMARGEPADMKRRTIRASMLRDLILEAHPGWTVPPAGLRIHHVIIDGCLDLEGCAVTKPLLLWHSRLQGGGDRGALLVRDARMKRLGIHSCTIEGAIVADRAQFESGLFLGGGLVKGSLQIRGGDISGALAIEGTEIGDGRTAMLGAGLRLSGPLILRRGTIKGEVALARAELGAGVYAEDAQFTHKGIALNLESARIKGDMLLERARIAGAFKLANARIGGRIAADKLTVDAAAAGEAAGPALPAIDATGIAIGQGLSLGGARLVGALMLEGAEIAKAFRAEGIEIDGGETAIGADVVTIGGNWDLARSKLVGSVSCPGADIRGQLRLTEARLFGSTVAIRADSARIRGGCFMSRAVVMGLVRFPAAEFGNQLRLTGASLKVDQGPALLAAGCSFARDVELGRGLQTIGAVVLDQSRLRGVLDLRGSTLTSAAIARDGAPAPQSRPNRAEPAEPRWDEVALSLVDARIDRLLMPEAINQRPRGIVDLSRAHAGAFEDYAAAWVPPPSSRARTREGRDIDHLVLDGFTYDHLANPSGLARNRDEASRPMREERVGESRVSWLEGQREEDLVTHFKPQAWVELGARLSTQGYHEDARTIAIARLRRERRSGSATAALRWQGRVLDLFALYGFNPWRTVIWMAAVILAYSGVWAWAASNCARPGCFDEGVFVVSNRDAYTPESFQRGYPEFHALAYSFDVFVPFVSFGYEDHWRPNLNWSPIAEIPWPAWAKPRDNATPARSPARPTGSLTLTWGGVLYVLGIIETVLGIILTSIAITGFTGLLRND